eukprot:gene9165-10138_t
MADKSTRFILPNLEDLDKSDERIQPGAIFQAKRKASANKTHDEENIIDDAKKHEGLGCCSKVDNCIAMEAEKQTATDIKSSADNNPESDPKSNVPVTNAKLSTNSIIVNSRQRGNPVLKYIRNVPWEYGDIVPDYVLGLTTCALFLSLRYHNFNPDYIHDRLKQLGNRFSLRILLVQVDVKDPHASLKELSKICILADCTLILSWSPEEAGRYLETYKSYENKPSDVLQERVEGDYHSKMIDCLTNVKSVNKTDAVTLMSNFGSLKNILEASKDEISLCPGFGPQKAERLIKICHEPFLKKTQRKEENIEVKQADSSNSSPAKKSRT